MCIAHKTKKKIWIGSIAVVIIVFVVMVVLYLATGWKPEPKKPFEIWQDQTTGEINRCFLKDGAGSDRSEWDIPLALYGFAPPSDWKQIQNATEQANQFSTFYQDIYQDSRGNTLLFLQRTAMQNIEISADQEVMFGEVQVIYHQKQESFGNGNLFYYQSTVSWVHENSLLQLIYTGSTPMEINPMLELVASVDYTAIREPVYSDLTLAESCSYSFDWCETYSEQVLLRNRSQGNPEIPEGATFAAFSRIPEGFVEMTSYREANNANHLPTVSYLGYQNGKRQEIYLTCWLGSNAYDSVGNRTGFGALGNYDAEQLQDAQVKGNPALLYMEEDCSCIGWIDGYRTVELDVMHPISREELIALAETVQ